MQIQQINISNFRCFKSQSIRFDPSFNLFFGDNGAGKTAILEALTIAAGSWLLGMPGYRERHIRPHDVRLSVFETAGSTVFLENYPVEIGATGIVTGQAISWSRSLTAKGRHTTWIGSRSLREIAAETYRETMAGRFPNLPIVAYYGADRLWLSSNESKSDSEAFNPQRETSPLEGYRGALDQRVDSKQFLRWMKWLAEVSFQDQEQKEPLVYRAVRNTLRRMVEHATDIRFDSRSSDIIIRFDDREPQAFQRLNDGHRNMLALAGDLAMRSSRLNPHLGETASTETPGIVLIDEIDLHLQPGWQRHVVADLQRTFPAIQFFATTHSPQVIGEVQPKSIIKLTRDGDDLKAEHLDQSYGLDSDWVLDHLMDASSRSSDARSAIENIEDAIDNGDYKIAHRRLEEVKRMLFGGDPEVTRLEASVNTLEALAHATD